MTIHFWCENKIDFIDESIYISDVHCFRLDLRDNRHFRENLNPIIFLDHWKIRHIWAEFWRKYLFSESFPRSRSIQYQYRPNTISTDYKMKKDRTDFQCSSNTWISVIRLIPADVKISKKYLKIAANSCIWIDQCVNLDVS